MATRTMVAAAATATAVLVAVAPANASRLRKGRFTRLSARYRRDGDSLTARWRLQVNSPTYAYWFARRALRAYGETVAQIT